jgi:hypothetical protein
MATLRQRSGFCRPLEVTGLSCETSEDVFGRWFAPGMGPSHFAGRILTVADREAAAIIARARTFRAAELPSEFSISWYGRSYVAPIRPRRPVQ